MRYHVSGGRLMDEPWAQLGDAISAIRAELARAEEEGRDTSMRFRTGPVELEFTVDVTVEGKGRAKVFVLPLSADMGAAASRDRMHRIKLTLQPVDEHGRDKKIFDQAVERPR